MDPHTHDGEGNIVITPDPVPEPIDPTPAVEVAAEADVRVAEIQAERDLALAKLDIKREELWQESRVAELEGKLAGMEATLAALAPPPPDPVVVAADPLADPEPELAPAPAPEAPPAEPPADKKSSGFWGSAYK